jgi:hypothetical protein
MAIHAVWDAFPMGYIESYSWCLLSATVLTCSDYPIRKIIIIAVTSLILLLLVEQKGCWDVMEQQYSRLQEFLKGEVGFDLQESDPRALTVNHGAVQPPKYLAPRCWTVPVSLLRAAEGHIFPWVTTVQEPHFPWRAGLETKRLETSRVLMIPGW